jgi:hypothetical protein
MYRLFGGATIVIGVRCVAFLACFSATVFSAGTVSMPILFTEALGNFRTVLHD